MDKKTIIARLSVFTLIIAGIVILMKLIVGAADVSSKYDGFLSCMADKGVKMYGAFWCPHCQEQEADLQTSRQNMEKVGVYVECSNPDRSSTQVCLDQKIDGYPTWVFPDGSRLSGYDSSNPKKRMSELSEKSGCELPTETSTK